LLIGLEKFPLDRMIKSRIARLRKHIEPDPPKRSFIKPVRGLGLVFSAVVPVL
jgi:DNA-binding response OmpR family regulator